MQRLFVAVVPPPAAAGHLKEALAVQRDVLEGLRWTPTEHWHVTLAFLPAVPPAAVPDLVTRLGRAASRRTVGPARVAGAGAFPRTVRATVVWAGVRTENEELARLAAGCRAAARRVGVQTPDARFRPHLTLARLSRPRDVTPVVDRLTRYSGPPWPVAAVRLVASHLGKGPGGRPLYETLAELPLRG